MRVAYVSAQGLITYARLEMEAHREAGWEILSLVSAPPSRKAAGEQGLPFCDLAPQQAMAFRSSGLSDATAS